jgi:hypothetical protein
MNYQISNVSVVMHRDKEDGLHDPGFRSRDLTALDHSVLDGDMFLQVRLIKSHVSDAVRDDMIRNSFHKQK